MIQLYGRGINSFAELQQEDVKPGHKKWPGFFCYLNQDLG